MADITGKRKCVEPLDPMAECVLDMSQDCVCIPDFSTYIVDHSAEAPTAPHIPSYCSTDCWCPCRNCQSLSHQRTRGIR